MSPRLAIVCVGLALVAVACAPKVAPTVVPAAPAFPEFVAPPVPASAAPAVAADLAIAWRLLQEGNTGGADRTYARVLKATPASASAMAGLGYVALARRQHERAVARFEEALAALPSLTSALVGKGQALLELNRPADALASFEAAMAADPQLALAPRIETLRFRVVEDSVAQARALAGSQQWEQARAAYEAALRVSPDSAVLYRELAGVERRSGFAAEADAHLGRALELDPTDRATHLLLAETREEAGDFDGAIASYGAAQALEPSADVEARLERVRERADLARLPEQFQSLSTQTEATRADVAAAFAVRVPGLLARAPARATPVITDLRGHWARPFIVASLRAGIVKAYPNHTFQPNGRLTRAELAQAVLGALDLLASQGDRRADLWRRAQPVFGDLPSTHPAYPAAAQVTAAGVLDAPSGLFAPTRWVSGPDLLDAVARVQQLAGPLAGRPRR